MNEFQHYESAKYYARAHNLLGIPVVVFSSIVGTTVFATLQKQVALRSQIIVGAVSVLAAVLAALQTFLRFSERAEKHRSIAASYSAIRRQLELVLNEPIEIRGNTKELVDSIKTRFDSLADAAPNVPNRVWKQVQGLKTKEYFGSPSQVEKIGRYASLYVGGNIAGRDIATAAPSAAKPSASTGASADTPEPYRP